MKPFTPLALLTATSLFSLTQAAVIVSHDGANDPTTEGFANTDPGVGTTAGSIINDLGTGLDAWFVDDDSLSGGSTIIYRSALVSEVVTDAFDAGWRLSTNLRVTEGPTTGFSDGVSTIFFTGSTVFGMTFDMEVDGDPSVTLIGNGSFTLDGVGNTGYHFYELVYDPLAGSADLFIDGVERISDYTGTATSSVPTIAWGGYASNATGRGHFNSVTFTVVPEPSSMLLLGLGTVVCLTGRRRA